MRIRLNLLKIIDCSAGMYTWAQAGHNLQILMFFRYLVQSRGLPPHTPSISFQAQFIILWTLKARLSTPPLLHLAPPPPLGPESINHVPSVQFILSSKYNMNLENLRDFQILILALFKLSPPTYFLIICGRYFENLNLFI